MPDTAAPSLVRPARRRRLPLTPLIDVIFLLLLFFMLSTSFTRFSEVGLATAATGPGAPPDAPRLFLRLGPDTLDLAGAPVALAALPAALAPHEAPHVLVALRGGVTAQRLTDLLVVLRAVPGAQITVLEGQ